MSAGFSLTSPTSQVEPVCSGEESLCFDTQKLLSWLCTHIMSCPVERGDLSLSETTKSWTSSMMIMYNSSTELLSSSPGLVVLHGIILASGLISCIMAGTYLVAHGIWLTAHALVWKSSLLIDFLDWSLQDCAAFPSDRVPRRKASADDVCAICLDSMASNSEVQLQHCPYGCGKPCHRKCLRAWWQHGSRCPNCNVEWHQKRSEA